MNVASKLEQLAIQINSRGEFCTAVARGGQKKLSQSKVPLNGGESFAQSQSLWQRKKKGKKFCGS